MKSWYGFIFGSPFATGLTRTQRWNRFKKVFKGAEPIVLDNNDVTIASYLEDMNLKYGEGWNGK